MGLLEDLEGIQPTVQGDLCTVHKVIEAFPEQADGIWRSVMDTSKRRLSGGDIARLFGKYGFPASSNTVNRHRRGDCACRQRMPERYDS